MSLRAILHVHGRFNSLYDVKIPQLTRLAAVKIAANSNDELDVAAFVMIHGSSSLITHERYDLDLLATPKHRYYDLPLSSFPCSGVYICCSHAYTFSSIME